MKSDPFRALVVIALDIEQGFRVRRPGDAAAGRGDRFRVLLTGFDVPNADVVVLRAQPVHAVGDELVVRAVAHGADAEERLALALPVAVEEDGLIAAVARHANEDRVFAAFAKAHSVGIRPIVGWHAAVVFLDAAAHFPEELLAQIFQVAGCRLVVRVLGDEVPTNVFVQHLGIAQHLLPVVVAHPGVIVDSRLPVLLDFDRQFFRHRRFDRDHGKRLLEIFVHCLAHWLFGGPGGIGAAGRDGKAQDHRGFVEFAHVVPPPAGSVLSTFRNCIVR